MTEEQNPQQTAQADENANRPTHVVKLRHGTGKAAHWERIGAAWLGDKGSIYVKLHGTQIIADGFTLYPVTDR